MIREAASQNKRRGRPKNDALELSISTYSALCGGVFADIKSKRGMQDVVYRMKAIAVLKVDNRFSWLYDNAKAAAGVAGAWKPSILSELGRVNDIEVMKDIALHICETKPKTKQAVAAIRALRTNKTATPNYLSLMQHIENSIDAYYATHTGTPKEWRVKALLDYAAFLENG
jgi:hypothetical protein